MKLTDCKSWQGSKLLIVLLEIVVQIKGVPDQYARYLWEIPVMKNEKETGGGSESDRITMQL